MRALDLGPWLWLIAPLGVCRGTQIVLYDDILRAPRRALIARSIRRRPGQFAYLAKLLTCPWCMSVWVALVAVAGLSVVRLTDHVWGAGSNWSLAARIVGAVDAALLAALALSLVAVVLDGLIDRALPESSDATPPEPEAPGADVASVLDSLEG